MIPHSEVKTLPILECGTSVPPLDASLGSRPEVSESETSSENDGISRLVPVGELTILIAQSFSNRGSVPRLRSGPGG